MRKKLSDTFDDFEKYVEVLPQLKKDTNIEFEYTLEETLKEIIDHLRKN